MYLGLRLSVLGFIGFRVYGLGRTYAHVLVFPREPVV